MQTMLNTQVSSMEDGLGNIIRTFLNDPKPANVLPPLPSPELLSERQVKERSPSPAREPSPKKEVRSRSPSAES